MTINRDQLAVEILLKSDCHFDPKKVYEIVDQMINQSNKTSFARMVVGPVVKQTNLQSPQSQSPQKSLQPKVSLMANVLKDDEKTVARFEFFDGKGFPIPLDKVKLDGVPVWATVDPARITVAPAPDGLSAIITAVGGPEPPNSLEQLSLVQPMAISAKAFVQSPSLEISKSLVVMSRQQTCMSIRQRLSNSLRLLIMLLLILLIICLSGGGMATVLAMAL